MDSSQEILQVLEQIRDLQEQHLKEYEVFAERSLTMQEDAVRQQAAMGSLYKRVVLVAGIVVLGMLLFLVVFLLR